MGFEGVGLRLVRGAGGLFWRSCSAALVFLLFSLLIHGLGAAQSGVLRVEAIDFARTPASYELSIDIRGEGAVEVLQSGTVFRTVYADEVAQAPWKTSWQFDDGSGEPTPAELRAVPSAGWCFERWLGDLAAVDRCAKAELRLDQKRSVTAVFVQSGCGDCPEEQQDDSSSAASSLLSTSGPAGFGTGLTADTGTTAASVSDTVHSPIGQYNFAYEGDRISITAILTGNAENLLGRRALVELSYLNEVNQEIGTIGRTTAYIPQQASEEIRLKISIPWEDPSPQPGRYRVTARAFVESEDGAVEELSDEATVTFYVLRYGIYPVPLASESSSSQAFRTSFVEDKETGELQKVEVPPPSCLRGRLDQEKLGFRMRVLNLGSDPLTLSAPSLQPTSISFRTERQNLFRKYDVETSFFQIELRDNTEQIPRGAEVTYRMRSQSLGILQEFLGDGGVFNFAGAAAVQSDKPTQGLGIGRSLQLRMGFQETGADVIFPDIEQISFYTNQEAWSYGGSDSPAACQALSDQEVLTPPTVNDQANMAYFTISQPGVSRVYARDMRFEDEDPVQWLRRPGKLSSPVFAVLPHGKEVLLVSSTEGKLYALDIEEAERQADHGSYLYWEVTLLNLNPAIPPHVVEDGTGKAKWVLVVGDKDAKRSYAIAIPESSSAAEPTQILPLFQGKLIESPVVHIGHGEQFAVYAISGGTLYTAPYSAADYIFDPPKPVGENQAITTELVKSGDSIVYGSEDGTIWRYPGDQYVTTDGSAVVSLEVKEDFLYALTANGNLYRWESFDAAVASATEEKNKIRVPGHQNGGRWHLGVLRTAEAEAIFVVSTSGAGRIRGFTVDEHSQLVDLHVTIWGNADGLFWLDGNEEKSSLYYGLTHPAIFTGTSKSQRLLVGSQDGYVHALVISDLAIPDAFRNP